MRHIGGNELATVKLFLESLHSLRLPCRAVCEVTHKIEREWERNRTFFDELNGQSSVYDV